MKHDPRFEELCAAVKKRVKETTVAEVKQRLDAGESFLLIDVREESEWNAGHIPSAVHVGKGVIERDIHTKVSDPGTEMVLYCGGGYRSALAVENLNRMGYTNVISMDGGVRGWKDAGYSLETE